MHKHEDLSQSLHPQKKPDVVGAETGVSLGLPGCWAHPSESLDCSGDSAIRKNKVESDRGHPVSSTGSS